MKTIQIVSAEIISLEADFQATASPDTWVHPNGYTAIMMGQEGLCLLIGNNDNALTIQEA